MCDSSSENSTGGNELTLIAGVKGENEGCIIFDYRLTRPSGSQYDAANKFAFYDNRLALFMAGQVLLLDKIIDRIQIKGAAITHVSSPGYN